MVIDSLIPWGVESSQLPKRTLSLLVLIRSQAYKTEDIACTNDAYIIDTLGLLSWFLLKLSAVPISIPVLLVGFACQKIDNDVRPPTPCGVPPGCLLPKAPSFLDEHGIIEIWRPEKYFTIGSASLPTLAGWTTHALVHALPQDALMAVVFGGFPCAFGIQYLQ